MQEQEKLLMEIEVTVDAKDLLPLAATHCFAALLPNGTMAFDFGYVRPEELVGAIRHAQAQPSNQEPAPRFNLVAPGVSRIVMTRVEAEQFIRSVVALLEKNPLAEAFIKT